MDRPNVVWLNVPYLLPVSVLPFGAALLARYDRDATALSMYGLLLLILSIARLCVWLYATNRPHLLHEPVSTRTKTVGVIVVVVPAAFYALAILISDDAPGASVVIYAVAPILYFKVGLLVDRSVDQPPGPIDEAVV